MKHFAIEKINRAIRAIVESNTTLEHVTTRAGSELARNYFENDRYTIVPEQMQAITRKRPDFFYRKIFSRSFS